MEIRRYLEELRRVGRLVEIDGEVDWNLESEAIGAMMTRTAIDKSYCLLYNNIKGYYPDKGRLVTYLYLWNQERNWAGSAFALGMPMEIGWEDFKREYIRRMSSPIKPIELAAAEAPCKEVIKIGKDANLLDLPIPYHHSGDGGRYFTQHGFVNRDPDTGWINIGLYRFMVKGPRRGGMLFSLGQQGPTIFYTKYEPRGETMPFCITLNADSCELIVYSTMLPAGVCEYDIIGGLRQEPLELVRAETTDLVVPARAEVIIEGEARPGERTDEGPFGEYSGFITPRNVSPLFRVNAITTRKNPILPFTLMGFLGCDGGQCMRLADVYACLSYLWDIGYTEKDVSNITWTAEGCEAWYAANVDPATPQDLQNMIQYLYGIKAIWLYKHQLCDKDVNILYSPDVYEAFARHFDPRDLKLHQTDLDVFMHPLAVMTDSMNRFRGTDAAKVCYDATTKFKDPKYVWRKDTFEHAYPADVRGRVEEVWSKLGFDHPLPKWQRGE